MATKLKNLKITKVDFVDEGANPDAHTTLRKRKDAEGSPGLLHRLISWIGKAAGVEQAEIDSAVDEISKGESVDFKEALDERTMEERTDKISNEIWDICFALHSSLVSIVKDSDLDSTSAEASMRDSIAEFNTLVDGCIANWSGGRQSGIVSKNLVTEDDRELLQKAIDHLDEILEKAKTTKEEKEKYAPDEEEDPEGETKKGGSEEMKIDKSKLTAGEKAFLEEIEKKAGAEEAEEAAPAQGNAEDLVKSKTEETPEAAPATEESTEESDIYKGISPEVKAEIEALRKFREEAEDRELTAIAKKYEVIGKKPEDLVPTLKSLKAAGGTAYNDMIAVLDAAVDTVQKSGAFTEIGKSGHGNNDHSAWAEADAKATELMKSRAGMTRAQALDEVLQNDPALAERCEKED